jgi:hypothetical protein
MDTKHFIYSKTLWLAVLVGAIGVLQALPSEALPPKVASGVQGLLAVLLIVNRLVSTPSTLTVTKQEQFNG